MGKIIIDFEALKEDAIRETYDLFNKEHPNLQLDLNEALEYIGGYIAHYAYIIRDIERQLIAGLIDEAIAECKEEIDFLKPTITKIRYDPFTGYRVNSVNFGNGGIAISNDYCKFLFLVNLNVEIIGKLKSYNTTVLEKTLNYNDDNIGNGETFELELGLRQIALFYFYENLPLNNNNAAQVVTKFKTTSRDGSKNVLMREYKRIIYGGQLDIIKHKNAVRDLTKVITLLRNNKSIESAKQDLQNAIREKC